MRLELVERRTERGINKHTVLVYEAEGDPSRHLAIDRNHDVLGHQYYIYKEGQGGEGCGTIWYEDLRAAKREVLRLFESGEPVQAGQGFKDHEGNPICERCSNYYSVGSPEYEKCWRNYACDCDKGKHAKRAASGREVMKAWKNVHRLLDEKQGGKDSKKVANNTYLKRRGMDIAVMLHETDVITYRADMSVVLDSGGWRTPTTKDRMNGWLPDGYGITQAEGVWYLHTPTRGVFVYMDGMRIGAHGAVHGAGRSTEYKRVQREVKAIREYARAFAAAMVAGEIEAPNGGDCWYCLMKNDEGKTLGDPHKNKNHLREHIKSKYYVPSLLWNAIESVPTPIAMKQAVVRLWQKGELLWSKDYAEREIRRVLVKYLKKQLGIGGGSV